MRTKLVFMIAVILISLTALTSCHDEIITPNSNNTEITNDYDSWIIYISPLWDNTTDSWYYGLYDTIYYTTYYDKTEQEMINIKDSLENDMDVMDSLSNQQSSHPETHWPNRDFIYKIIQ